MNPWPYICLMAFLATAALFSLDRSPSRNPSRAPAAEEVILWIDPPPPVTNISKKMGREDVTTVHVDDIQCFYVGPSLPDRNPHR